MEQHAVRSLVAATLLTALIVGGPLLVVLVVGSQTSPITAGHLQTSIVWVVVGSIFVWPVLFVVSLVCYVWPGVAKGSGVGATTLLILLSGFMVFNDVRSGQAVNWFGNAVVWLIVWPLLFGIGMIHGVGAKLGKSLLDSLRGQRQPTLPPEARK